MTTDRDPAVAEALARYQAASDRMAALFAKVAAIASKQARP